VVQVVFSVGTNVAARTGTDNQQIEWRFRQRVLFPLCDRSHLQQQPWWILDQVFDPYQKQHRIPAIDEPVIVREGDIHHGTDLNALIRRDWALLDGMHTEDGTLLGV
jgi:hypothetical protein